jgi:hypothetical protein
MRRRVSRAAHHLLGLGRKGKPLTRAPFTVPAIHAIELFLNVLLLHRRQDPARIRRLQHDLKTRGELAMVSGLALR